MKYLPCLCDGRDDIRCDAAHCDIAAAGEPGNPNQCRVCWLRLQRPAVQAPSLARRVVNFARAIMKHARAGLPVVTEEEAKRRISICETCELFDLNRRRCNHPQCGCNMDEKVTWGEQKCPIGKW